MKPAVVLALVGLAVVIGPVLSPYDAVAIDVGPLLAAPSTAHWLGTDSFGRDLATRLLVGGRVSVGIGVLAAAVAVGLGTVLGTVGGWWGGAVDRLLVWSTDLVLALPRLVLLLAVLGVLRPAPDTRLWVVVALLAATGWMSTARLVRAQVQSLREREFVLAAVALGLHPARVLIAHVWPNLRRLVATQACLAVGSAMLSEAALSYLGLGLAPPAPSWGSLVDEGRGVFLTAPWVAVPAGLAIATVVLCLTWLADGGSGAERKQNA